MLPLLRLRKHDILYINAEVLRQKNGKMKLKRKINRENKADTSRKKSNFNFKLLFQLIGTFILVFGIYQTACYFAFKPILPIYLVITTVLLCVYIVLNRGFSVKPPLAEQLPDAWSEETKQKYIEEDIERKKKAKKLMIWIFPFVLTFLIDMVYLFYIFDN